MTPILILFAVLGAVLLVREWRHLQARDQRMLDVAHEGHQEPRGLIASPEIRPVELVVPKTEPERIFPSRGPSRFRPEPRSVFEGTVFTPVVEMPVFHFRDEPVHTYPVEDPHHRHCHEPSLFDQDSHHHHHDGGGGGGGFDDEC